MPGSSETPIDTNNTQEKFEAPLDFELKTFEDNFVFMLSLKEFQPEDLDSKWQQVVNNLNLEPKTEFHVTLFGYMESAIITERAKEKKYDLTTLKKFITEYIKTRDIKIIPLKNDIMKWERDYRKKPYCDYVKYEPVGIRYSLVQKVILKQIDTIYHIVREQLGLKFEDLPTPIPHITLYVGQDPEKPDRDYLKGIGYSAKKVIKKEVTLTLNLEI
jgi:hypothetical protein